MTLRELLGLGTDLLKAGNVGDALPEAESLLCHLLNKDRIHLYACGREPVNEDLTRRFMDLLGQRAEGKPLQYILGTVEFMGIPLTVDPSVLIPRQDTELLAEEALRALAGLVPSGESPQILDLCTGSGALAIAVAKAVPEARVTAADLSAGALEVARGNASAAGVAGRIRFCQGDLFDALQGQGDFHMILSNPPYIASGVIGSLAVEIRDHEPRMALDGGPDGLDLIRRILRASPGYLKPGGWLLMEIGYDQADAVRALARGVGKVFPAVEILRDLGGNDRVFKARKAL